MKKSGNGHDKPPVWTGTTRKRSREAASCTRRAPDGPGLAGTLRLRRTQPYKIKLRERLGTVKPKPPAPQKWGLVYINEVKAYREEKVIRTGLPFRFLEQ